MNPPSALHGAMSRERKPFTYTPGGLDLSEIKSERMAKRLMRNAMNQGVPEVPIQQVQSPPATSNPIMVPNFNCLPVQVFPTINLPANPKLLLRTRSNPDPKEAPVQRVQPPQPNQFPRPNKTDNNSSFVSMTNNNISYQRPSSMYEYNKIPQNVSTLPKTSYESNEPPSYLPEISYEAEYFQAPSRNLIQKPITPEFQFDTKSISENSGLIDINTKQRKVEDSINLSEAPIRNSNGFNEVIAQLECKQANKPKTGEHLEFIDFEKNQQKTCDSNESFKIPSLDISVKSEILDLASHQHNYPSYGDIIPDLDITVKTEIVDKNSIKENVEMETVRVSILPEVVNVENKPREVEIPQFDKSIISESENVAENNSEIDLDFSIQPISVSNIHSPFEMVQKPIEEESRSDDEQREVKVVKKQVKKESKSEVQNGDQNGDQEAQLTVKLPTKKSAAKTETKVEVVKKQLPDGSIEEVKTTTTKTTVDGKTTIATKTETTIIPKEDEEEEEYEEEEEEQEENGEVVVVEENGDNEITEEVVIKKSPVVENGHNVITKEETTETTVTKKVAVIQQEPEEEEEEEEEVEEEVVEEKKPAKQESEVEIEEEKEAEAEVVTEKVIEKVESKKEEIEVGEEEEEEEIIEESKVETEETPKAPPKEEDDEEVEEEYEEAEEKIEDEQLEKPEPNEKKEEEPEHTEEEYESEKEDTPKPKPQEEKEENEKEVITETKTVELQEEKKEPVVEPKPEPQPESIPEPTVPLREPSIPLEKVEEVEIKPIGLTSETVTKSHTENREILTSNERPSGPLSTQTEYNRIENIVTVNRTTKTLDHSYEQLTQHGVPTVKAYFAPPNRDRISTSPLPARPYQPVYPPAPAADPPQERRHSLLLERLSMERQMPSDIYQNNFSSQYSNQTYEQTRQYSQEPQAEVLTVSNVKPSTITNSQWYQQQQQQQQVKKENVLYNNVTVPAPAPTPAPVSQPWTQSQPSPQPPQPQYQPTYTDNPPQATYQQSAYQPYTPKPATWGASTDTLSSTYNTQQKQYSLNQNTTESYQNSTQQYSSGYVPPPWEQDASYVADVSSQPQNFYQAPPPTSTFTPGTNQGWKPTLPKSKFSKPPPTAYIPPAPNQSFVKPVNTLEPPRVPGKKTYYSEYERRYITVPESTYIPGETKYQPQPDPSPQYYYDNNEPQETVEPQWRKELREFTEKTSTQTTEQASSVKPPWEEDPKYAKPPSTTITYTTTPTWSQTLRPRSWRERSFESEYVGSQEFSKTSTLGRGRPLSSYGKNHVETIPERPRGVSVDRYNPNNYQAPVAAEHLPVQTHTLTVVPPAKSYHNPNVPAYHAQSRASAEPREQTIYPIARNWGDSRENPIQSRSFKYLQWITGTDD